MLPLHVGAVDGAKHTMSECLGSVIWRKKMVNVIVFVAGVYFSTACHTGLASSSSLRRRVSVPLLHSSEPKQKRIPLLR